MFLTGKHWYKFHRKLTHSLIFLLTPLIFINYPSIMIPIFWGMVSHLIIDAIWHPGIPLLYPFSKKRFYILPSKYSRGEKDGTPIIAIKNWFYDTKEVMIESAVIIIGLIIYLLNPA
jgi:membrane-bound metal-dependent hydrolase YbcI (DUF457 family)